MHSRIFALIPALFALTAVTFAQAAPKEAHADLVNSQGVKIGSAKFNPSDGPPRLFLPLKNRDSVES